MTPNSPSITLSIVTLILTSTLLGSAATVIFSNLRASADARRMRYSEVVQSVAAWVEYPYRIRRRVNDDASTLADLANHGHAIQEKLAQDKAWVAAESRAVSALLEECLSRLAMKVGDSCQDAWRAKPIVSAEQMNLGDFGPRGHSLSLVKLQMAISYRFGVRRLLWSSAVKKRVDRRCAEFG